MKRSVGMMVSASELERGMCVNIDGMPFVVERAQRVKYGKGAAFVRAELRNALYGGMCEREFNITDRLELTQL